MEVTGYRRETIVILLNLDQRCIQAVFTEEVGKVNRKSVIFQKSNRGISGMWREIVVGLAPLW